MDIINSIAAGVGITEQELQPILATLNDANQDDAAKSTAVQSFVNVIQQKVGTAEFERQKSEWTAQYTKEKEASVQQSTHASIQEKMRAAFNLTADEVKGVKTTADMIKVVANKTAQTPEVSALQTQLSKMSAELEVAKQRVVETEAKAKADLEAAQKVWSDTAAIEKARSNALELVKGVIANNVPVSTIATLLETKATLKVDTDGVVKVFDKSDKLFARNAGANYAQDIESFIKEQVLQPNNLLKMNNANTATNQPPTVNTQKRNYAV